jgi:hypothetical protein
MKKFSIVLFLITIGLLFSASLIYAELAKEGSGEYRGAKSGTFEVMPLGKDRIQMNYDETGAIVEAPENSPLTNASYRVIGTLHAINGKYKGSGAMRVTRPNGDQVFGVYKSEGVLGVGITSGLIELIGGTGECTGIEGKIEFLPRPSVKPSKKGTYQGIGVGKITWKIP